MQVHSGDCAFRKEDKRPLPRFKCMPFTSPQSAALQTAGGPGRHAAFQYAWWHARTMTQPSRSSLLRGAGSSWACQGFLRPLTLAQVHWPYMSELQCKACSNCFGWNATKAACIQCPGWEWLAGILSSDRMAMHANWQQWKGPAVSACPDSPPCTARPARPGTKCHKVRTQCRSRLDWQWSAANVWIPG